MEGDADDEALQPLVVDLQHLNSELVEIAIADLYTENAAERLHSRSKCLKSIQILLSMLIFEHRVRKGRRSPQFRDLRYVRCK